MKNIQYIALYSLIISALFSCSFNKVKFAEIYLENLNNGKIEEAKAQTDSAFKVAYLFENYEKMGNQYFEDYKRKILFNPKISIITKKSDSDKVIISTENVNDFSRYLGIPPMKVNYIFIFTNNKINFIQIDTLKGYSQYSVLKDQKWKDFKEWLNLNDIKSYEIVDKNPYDPIFTTILRKYKKP